MRTSLQLAATVGVALLLSPSSAQAQTPEQLAIIKRLGPDGFASAPPLDALVGSSVAAIVGRVVGTRDITLREVDNPYSDKKSVLGYAGYRVAVDDVLFNRNAGSQQRLAAGTVVELAQRAGGDSARRFFARQLPVAPGDTCLLFLWAGPEGVMLLGWSVQFRRAAGPTPTAETLGAASLATAMATTPDWFGPSVTMLATPRGAAPEWASLLAEVRRLGTLDASAARQR